MTTTSNSLKARLVAGLLATIGLVLTVAPLPAHAVSLGDSFMSCYEGTGLVSFSLPIVGTGAYSEFWFSVDGSEWNVSQLYYSSGISGWVWNGSGWESLYDGFGPSYDVGGGRVVHGWQKRYTNSDGWHWVNLGSCTTSSFFEGGLVFT